MAQFDNRSSANSDNMLRTLPRFTSQMLAYKSTNRQIPAALYFLVKNIHTTPVSTFKQTLPRLPIPQLQDTLVKYLRSIKPLLTSKQYGKTVSIVEQFGETNGIGEKLQSMLEERAKEHDNWLIEWWNNYAYLEFRNSVPIHVSPAYVFPLQRFCTTEERLLYTAKLIIVLLKYKELIASNELPIDKAGKSELDMGPYKKIFGTCRVPKQFRDIIKYHPHSKHIVLVNNNQFYKMYPMDENGQILSTDKIIELLKDFLDRTSVVAPAIGIMSADHRDNWNTYYQILTRDPHNKRCVDEIEKSLFLVCWDNKMPKSDANRLTIGGHQAIHGGGWNYNSGNRWFDKTMQFFIGVDGITGICYEHSPLDAHPISIMIDFLMDNLDSASKFTKGVTSREIEHLNFHVDNEIKEVITCSGEYVNKQIANFDMVCNVFEFYGKNFIKSQKLSPDSFIQMAMQYAYYKSYKVPGVHYEAAATRKYLHGRTETIRSCSVESIQFAQIMLSDKSATEKRKYLERAIDAHKKYSIEAANGFGVDRHLLGLKLIAEEYGIETPKIFKDEAYAKSTHFVLSTSQVPTKCAGYLCFGPVVEDGYGFCYNPRDNDIYYAISSFKSNRNTCSKTLSEAFEECLMQMHDILQKSMKAKL